MARLMNITLIILSLVFSRALTFVSAHPTSLKPVREALIARGDVTYVAADEETGQLTAYREDGSVVAVFPPGENLETRAGSGCRVMTVAEAKSLDGWDDIVAFAKSQWGDGSYNLGTEFEGQSALVCVDPEPSVLDADATPSCTTRSSTTGGSLAGANGSVTISYTEGFSTSGTLTVTESTTLGASMTANVGFKVPDVLDVGASITTSTEVTNQSSEGFTINQSSQETQSITMNSEEGKTCTLEFTTKECTVQGSGNVRYIASGWMWFNYNDKTQGHYRWAVNIESVVQDVNRRSQTASVHGLISGTSTSNYQGKCL